MLFKADELIKALNGDTEKAQSVYEWAQKTPMAQMMSAVEVIKEYDNRFEGETQEKIEMGNYKEDDMATGFSSDAVDQVEDNTSNEAPQPIFAGYKKADIEDFDEDEMLTAVEDWELDEYDMVYKKNGQYYDMEIADSKKVPIAPVADERFKGYYITADGVLVRKLKKDGRMITAAAKKSDRTGSIHIQKRDPKTKKIFYAPIGVLVYRTFVDKTYDKNVIMYNKKNMRNLCFYNLNPGDKK